MKEFLKALEHVSIVQLTAFIFFMFINGVLSGIRTIELYYIIPFVSIVVLLFIYYYNVNNVLKKYKLESFKYNTYLFFLWNAYSLLIMFITLFVLDKFLSFDIIFYGLLFYLEYISLVFLSLLILIINIIILVYKKIKNKTVKK